MTGSESRNESPGVTQGDPVAEAGSTGAGTGTSSVPQIEISSDEDWKSRVKAEDAALDQRFETEETKSPSALPENSAREKSAPRGERSPDKGRRAAGPQMPEPSFAGLVGMLSTQAMVALGLFVNPATQKTEKDLPVARYFIDLIAVLEQKTANNLNGEEAAALDETLHTLRMAYVQRSKETS